MQEGLPQRRGDAEFCYFSAAWRLCWIKNGSVRIVGYDSKLSSVLAQSNRESLRCVCPVIGPLLIVEILVRLIPLFGA